MNPQQVVELFHLLFLQHLSEKLEKSFYAVKGGCNLRFFFKSIRYSEDLDIDVKTVAKETLKNKVNKIFESRNLQQSLFAKGMQIVHSTESKQTETTQRWKLGIQQINSSMPLPTKIEFSLRKMDKAILFEPVDQELIQRYQLYPILINHYSQEVAFCQKVDALIYRTETQARDVFDLQLLLNRKVTSECLPDSIRKELGIAIKNALSIGFSEFKSQVVAYLMDEYRNYYDSQKIWNEMQEKVVDALEKAKL